MLKQSFIQSNGVSVSTINSGGGIGLGYLYDGKVYQSCGNGYYKCDGLIYAIVDYKVDNGEYYKKQFSCKESI